MGTLRPPSTRRSYAGGLHHRRAHPARVTGGGLCLHPVTRIKQYTVDNATNDQPAAWTMNHFEFPEDQSASVANALADVLDAHLGTDPERLNKAITAAPDLLTDVGACLSSVLHSVRILQLPG